MQGAEPGERGRIAEAVDVPGGVEDVVAVGPAGVRLAGRRTTSPGVGWGRVGIAADRCGGGIARQYGCAQHRGAKGEGTRDDSQPAGTEEAAETGHGAALRTPAAQYPLPMTPRGDEAGPRCVYRPLTRTGESAGSPLARRRRPRGCWTRGAHREIVRLSPADSPVQPGRASANGDTRPISSSEPGTGGMNKRRTASHCTRRGSATPDRVRYPRPRIAFRRHGRLCGASQIAPHA